MPLFAVNEANLAHLKDVIDQFGEAWIHGDGNVYADKQSHLFHRDFSAPLRAGEVGPGSYWAFFNNIDEVPQNVGQLKKIFLANKEKQVEAREEGKKKEELKIVKQKTPTSAPKVDPNAEKQAELANKEKDLSEWSEKLTSTTTDLTQRQKQVTAQQKELDAKAAQLAAREKELEAKLAKLQAGEKKNGGANPSA